MAIEFIATGAFPSAGDFRSETAGYVQTSEVLEDALNGALFIAAILAATAAVGSWSWFALIALPTISMFASAGNRR